MVTQKQITQTLQKILCQEDIDRDSPITRAKSCKHESRIEVLLEHVKILVANLRHDAESSRRELFEVRDIIENDGNIFYE